MLGSDKAANVPKLDQLTNFLEPRRLLGKLFLGLGLQLGHLFGRPDLLDRLSGAADSFPTGVQRHFDSTTLKLIDRL